RHVFRLRCQVFAQTLRFAAQLEGIGTIERYRRVYSAVIWGPRAPSATGVHRALAAFSSAWITGPAQLRRSSRVAGDPAQVHLAFGFGKVVGDLRIEPEARIGIEVAR